jgi:hypothetical protein
MIQLTVNGTERSFDGDPEMPLLWYLRDILGLTGAKFGCGIALCGACTVHKNRQAVRAYNPYDVPNLRIENGPAKAHVRIGWLRSVANIYHGFAIPTFTDELAHRSGRDPVEYLLELIGPDRTIDFKGLTTRTTEPLWTRILGRQCGCAG